MFRIPGRPIPSPPPLTEAQRALRDALDADVRELAESIGERHVWRPSALHDAADFIAQRFDEIGLSPQRQSYDVVDCTCDNIIAELPGGDAAHEIVVIGAHYDCVEGAPGADDNATGVAALLALARMMTDNMTRNMAGKMTGKMAGGRPRRTVRFVAFVNEEPPFFHSPEMGSAVYAERCRRAGDDVRAMLAMDGLGSFDDAAGSQSLPAPVPVEGEADGADDAGAAPLDRADFIALVSDESSAALLRTAATAFAAAATVRAEAVALPAAVPGAAWSDHWAFEQAGYPALMVTDTLPYRYGHYHAPTDTPDKLDMDRFTRVVAGLGAVVSRLGAGTDA